MLYDKICVTPHIVSTPPHHKLSHFLRSLPPMHRKILYGLPLFYTVRPHLRNLRKGFSPEKAKCAFGSHIKRGQLLHNRMAKVGCSKMQTANSSSESPVHLFIQDATPEYRLRFVIILLHRSFETNNSLINVLSRVALDI